jgi:hypothetical protein
MQNEVSAAPRDLVPSHTEFVPSITERIELMY